jgi:superfamily II DNA or RNA helicase
MGYLTEQIADEVGRLTQERGRQYYVRGAVTQIDGDGRSVNAVVQGTLRYTVEIMSIDDFLDYSCSCPYFERDLEPCKHIWATCLAAEKKGYLRKDQERARFQPVHELFPSKRARPTLIRKPPPPGWQEQLAPVLSSLATAEYRSRFSQPAEREFIYLIDAEGTLSVDRVVLEVAQRQRLVNGAWGKLKTKKLALSEIDEITDAADRRILAILFGSRQDLSHLHSSYFRDSTYPNFVLPAPLWDVALPLICATHRCVLRQSMNDRETPPLQWDGGAPWDFHLKVEPDRDGKNYSVSGVLRRDQAEMSLVEPCLLVPGGLVFYEDRVARLNDHGAFQWILLLKERKSLSIPRAEGESFLAEVLRFARRPQLSLPEDLAFEEIAPRPKPSLVVRPGPSHPFRHPRLLGKLSFDYAGQRIPYDQRGSSVYQKNQRRVIRRDLSFETAARRRLTQLGFRSANRYDDGDTELYGDQLPKVVRALTSEGWQVEAQGKLYRTAAALKVEVKSGVDWFELEGSVLFGDTKVSLPRLLRAIRQGESLIKLDDGTLGVLPEEWIKKYGLLAGLGTIKAEQLRFTRPQAGLLDALLSSEPGVSFDANFARVRQELADFSGVAPADPPPQFAGELRGYQREGLGWLFFLQRFGFGGCLADDMGLGKTIQVLALLEARRAGRSADDGDSPRPSLVVVPRSLIFHWKREAARFAPNLAILDHSGAARHKPGDHFADYDLVLTTYGTLTRDAIHFKEQRFDYCILDEAQAIKNAGTLSAKAVRLLHADHRLAMSGTPVENHLGELWSLFEFLNPGMLGSASVFTNVGRNPDERTRALLARALRPFILRRTKGQVATELPEKTEQTIYCDLEAKERKLYDELRDFYRSRLLKNDTAAPDGRYKIQVLEALLRLRQAACHPGLIDKKRIAEPSAKIDTLLAQLDQVLEENHKVLVFSQFTSLLAIVRSRLDTANVPYAYLDGRTRDREARVEQFQHDPDVKLFLISLKAGGLGLNLHAAEYVYLLDPWWNPAVEAQAIDRAHRIGQTRHVFAYRLIARDTVEEKVLALQQSKRDLADAIISADNSLMRDLSREDLELLLS